jgi:agmatinase
MSGIDLGRDDGPFYAGMVNTFCGQELVLQKEGLPGADVAVLGAPFDDGTSGRPGTRFGPRAIRDADEGGRWGRPHMTLGIDPLEAMKVVDYGDAEPTPGNLPQSPENLRARLRDIYDAGAIPLVLGGDHSLSLSQMHVLAERYGADGYSVLHLDTHADTAPELYGTRLSHGAPFRVAVEDGVMNGGNIAQVGLRGNWPDPPTFEWMREAGFRWFTMDEIDERGLEEVVSAAIVHVAARAPRTYLTVDIDVLDPAYAPGTGTPEPGGLTTRELMRVVRRAALELDLCAMDIVEVSPPYDVSQVTALAAERVAVEALAGIAARRSRD